MRPQPRVNRRVNWLQRPPYARAESLRSEAMDDKVECPLCGRRVRVRRDGPLYSHQRSDAPAVLCEMSDHVVGGATLPSRPRVRSEDILAEVPSEHRFVSRRYSGEKQRQESIRTQARRAVRSLVEPLLDGRDHLAELLILDGMAAEIRALQHKVAGAANLSEVAAEVHRAREVALYEAAQRPIPELRATERVESADVSVRTISGGAPGSSRRH